MRAFKSHKPTRTKVARATIYGICIKQERAVWQRIRFSLNRNYRASSPWRLGLKILLLCYSSVVKRELGSYPGDIFSAVAAIGKLFNQINNNFLERIRRAKIAPLSG